MRITVLGKSPSWPDAGGACSGYLVSSGDYSMLLDCGTGVFARLRLQLDYLALDAVLITHLHSDHFFDLVPFTYALLHGPRSPRQSPPLLHLPPGGIATVRAMTGAWGSEDLIESAFDAREYNPQAGVTIGRLQVRFCEMPHFTQTFAVDLSDGASRLTFGADCAPNPALVQFAHGTDLLLAESTLTEPEEGPRGHMSAREAGEVAAQAQARRLVLTHFSDELDAAAHLAQAREAFGGEVELAEAGAVYDLDARDTLIADA